MSLLVYNRHAAPFGPVKHTNKFYQEHMVTVLIAFVVILFTFFYLTAGEKQETTTTSILSVEAMQVARKQMLARIRKLHTLKQHTD